MLLFIILALFTNQSSKIPYQQQLAHDESRQTKSYSNYVSKANPVIANVIPDANADNKSRDQKTDAEDNSQPRTMLRWTIALVIVNAVYVCVAFLQWRAIKYQVRMSHRAQLAPSPHGVFELFEGDAPRIQITLANIGGSTAYNCRYETWTELLPFPFTDFSSRADHVIFEEPCVLYPKHVPLTINIPIRPRLTMEDRRDILALRRFVCIRIRATYKDALVWHQRYASAAFYVEKDGLAFLPKYNDAN
jgi:hypothetical protein